MIAAITAVSRTDTLEGLSTQNLYQSRHWCSSLWDLAVIRDWRPVYSSEASLFFFFFLRKWALLYDVYMTPPCKWSYSVFGIIDCNICEHARWSHLRRLKHVLRLMHLRRQLAVLIRCFPTSKHPDRPQAPWPSPWTCLWVETAGTDFFVIMVFFGGHFLYSIIEWQILLKEFINLQMYSA